MENALDNRGVAEASPSSGTVSIEEQIYRMSIEELCLAYTLSLRINDGIKSNQRLPGPPAIASYEGGLQDNKTGLLFLDMLPRQDFAHNPYPHEPLHPVEDGLRRANVAAEIDDIEAFLGYRNNALRYMEPQYQRVMGAAHEMMKLVKKHKVNGGHSDTDNWLITVPVNRGLEGLLVAELYAKAFIRDVPLATEKNIKRMQRRFDVQLRNSTRAMALRSLNDGLDEIDGQGYSDREVWKAFSNAFMDAVVDMDEQHIEIREARKKLYDNVYRGNLDLELWRPDQAIDFHVNEP